MDFFENQEAARTKTRWLVFLFFIAVVFIIFSVYIAVRLIFFGLETKFGLEAAAAWGMWSPELFLAVTVVTLAIVSLGSLYKIVSLSGGGETVAGLLGGRPLDPNTTRLEERRLLNVVEEMALASGMPTPTVFVLPKEMGINAFAAGFTPSDAVIGVTEGSLQNLSRDELQGVIGHEFSHILNGDMRLNLRLMGVIHGILVIALIGYWMLRSVRFTGGSGNRKSSGSGAIVLLAISLLLVIGWIGVFFGRLIKSAVSRQREFLADSAAVQFTRDPGGLAGALKKIGGFVAGSKLETPHAEEASHFYFSNGLRPAFLQMLATHPPLATRIRRLEPGWDGVFPDAKLAPGELPSTTPELAVAGVSGLAGAPSKPAKPDTGGPTAGRGRQRGHSKRQCRHSRPGSPGLRSLTDRRSAHRAHRKRSRADRCLRPGLRSSPRRRSGDPRATAREPPISPPIPTSSTRPSPCLPRSTAAHPKRG